jgi:hypothetical protein
MCLAASLPRALPLGAALCLLLAHASAHAALRSPQVVVNGGGLQGYLNSEGESINVQTDQEDVQVFQPVMSGFASTYQFEAALKDAGLEVGIYDGHLSSPDLVPVFPASSGPEWFAVVTFRQNPDRVVINLFDATVHLVSTQTHLGLTDAGFGFYVLGPGGALYSQDVRNPGGAAQALFFRGTGRNSGSWWICFEGASPGDSDRDFDDAVLFNQFVTGVPVHTASWAELKARFR